MRIGQIAIALLLLTAGTAMAASPAAPGPGRPTAAAPALSAGMIGPTWEWISFADGKSQMTIPHPERYTVSFTADRVAIKADCNRGSGGYRVGRDFRITFEAIAVTRAMCPPGSLDDRFLQLLNRVTSYHDFHGDLLLELPADSGTLRFRRAGHHAGYFR